MDQAKTGSIIQSLRRDLGLTQNELADMVGISDKAVSKWERGMGMPDLSLLPKLSEILKVDMESLISGNLEENQSQGGNMKKLKFYVCSECGNVITSTEDTSVSCCGKKLTELEMKKADDDHKLDVEIIENEYYITSEHEMKKEHYIDFVALVSGDTLILKKQYPEWDLQSRIPKIAHGKLIWHCNKHDLFYQLI